MGLGACRDQRLWKPLEQDRSCLLWVLDTKFGALHEPPVLLTPGLLLQPSLFLFNQVLFDVCAYMRMHAF